MNKKKLEFLEGDQFKLINKMLQFNPNKRSTAVQLLSLPIFDDIRLKELENRSGPKIKLSIDAEGFLDYEN